MTDNIVYSESGKDPVLLRPLPNDDRLLFTEEDPRKDLYVAKHSPQREGHVAIQSPSCCEVRDNLRRIVSPESLGPAMARLNAAAELYLTTSKNEYENVILENGDLISRNIGDFSEVIGGS